MISAAIAIPSTIIANTEGVNLRLSGMLTKHPLLSSILQHPNTNYKDS